MGGVAAESQWINEQLAWQIYTIDVRGKILIGPRPLFTPARRYAASRATPISRRSRPE
jgi:hypothetical protein